jgi:PAS domain S-box-containing protein
MTTDDLASGTTPPSELNGASRDAAPARFMGGLHDPGVLAWPALVFGFLLTLVVTFLLWERLTTSTQQRFDSEVEKVVAQISRRMVAHEAILRAAAGLMQASDHVSRSDWRAYVSELDLEHKYPGILGVGLTLRIPAARRAAHEAEIQRDDLPGYTIRPSGARDEYHSILYLEPLNDRNSKAIGYDMNSEPTRSAAMTRARDTGEAALTGRVTLVQEGKEAVQPGFLLYYPLYARSKPQGTPEERRRALYGYTYSPYRAHDLFGSALLGFSDNVLVEIHDGKVASPETLLFSNAGGRSAAPLEDVRQLTVAGHEWTIHTRAAESFGADHFVLWLVPFMGSGLSTLLFYVLRLLGATARANRIAHGVARALSMSESRLVTLLDTAADGIVTTDDSGMVLTANRAAAEIFHLRPEQMIGQSLTRLLPFFEPGWFSRQVGFVQPMERWRFRQDLQGVRGSRRFPVTVSASRFSLHGRPVFSLFMRDITDQIEAQTRMRLHDRALEASSEAVIIRDIQRSGHPVVYVNSAFERLTGRSASDVVNRPFSLMSGDLNPDTVLEEMRWALAHEKPFNTTVHVRRADGRSVWIALSSSPVRDNTGIVTHYVDVFGDVTERIEFERKLIRRTNRLHTVFALSPDGFVTFDENGTVTNVNPAFSRMTHLSQGELLGVSAVAFDRRIAALADPEKPWPELVLDRSTDEPQRLWLLHPEPRVIERSARVAPEGKSETVLYFRDITQQFEVDRLKGEFLSTAAHELRTPLASIFGFAELLINRDYDEPSRRRMHGVIHRQSRVLVNLINDLLDLARIEARAGQDFNLEDESVKSIINATVEGLAMPEGLQRLSLDVPRATPRIRVDHKKMVRALSNVITNAFKYSPDDSEVRVTVCEASRNSRLMAGMRVIDHGLGMTPAQQARIFERFYRADPSGNIPGTGLGMSLVKEIMDLHGGEIEIESVPGEGTTVTLWLPVMDTATS